MATAARSHLVAVSLDKSLRSIDPSVVLVFVPTSDGWNDFGFQIRCDVGFRGTDREFHWTAGYLAFQSESSTFSCVREHLEGRARSWDYLVRIPKAFASLLENVRSYQELRAELGKLSPRVLIEARDLGLEQGRAMALRAWPKLLESEVFRRAFMRRSEAVFAFDKAAQLVRARPLSAEDSRQTFRAKISIRGARLDFNFEFPETRVATNRIAVMIGRNGSGKTTSLIRLTRGLADRSARGVKIEPQPSVNQVIAFAHSRSLSRFRRTATPETAIHAVPLDPTRRATRDKGLVSRVVSLARRGATSGDLIARLSKILSSEFPEIDILIPVKRETGPAPVVLPSGSYCRLIDLSRGGEQARLDRATEIDVDRPIACVSASQFGRRQLSLGQDVFVSFAISAIDLVGEASVVLIDEPENFLHPNLLARMLRLLHTVLEATSSIAILATHSPFVVREVQSSQVHIIQGQGFGAYVTKPRMQTFGANVGAISDSIFDDDLVVTLSARLLSESDLGELASSPEGIAALSKDVSLDALMTVRNRLFRTDS